MPGVMATGVLAIGHLGPKPRLKLKIGPTPALVYDNTTPHGSGAVAVNTLFWAAKWAAVGRTPWRAAVKADAPASAIALMGIHAYA